MEEYSHSIPILKSNSFFGGYIGYIGFRNFCLVSQVNHSETALRNKLRKTNPAKNSNWEFLRVGWGANVEDGKTTNPKTQSGTKQCHGKQPPRIESSKASVSCKGSSAYFCRTRSQVLQLAAVESSPGHLGAKSTNQTPTAAVEGKLRSSTNRTQLGALPNRPIRFSDVVAATIPAWNSKASFPLIAPKVGPSKIFHQLSIF